MSTSAATAPLLSWLQGPWLDTSWTLFGHFLALSLMSIGGAITLVPDMHRRLVLQDHLLTDPQFTASIALAQAAPGPNILFVALLGWHAAGLPGAMISMLGVMLPSTTLALALSRWIATRRHWPSVQAFQDGMTPVTVGLLLATGWLLTPSWQQPRAWLASLVVATLVWRTRVRLIWLVGAGALLGGAGII